LTEVDASDSEALYEGILAFEWENHLSKRGTIAVRFIGVNESIRHSQFGSRKVKDAICDRLRMRWGHRPSVDLEQPDARITIRLVTDRAEVHLDLSGDSLHRRGYRLAEASAPIKENMAAGLLLRAGWPEAYDQGRPFLDPMCGTGTFVLEAAAIVADVAPGLMRRGHGFESWPGHDSSLWDRLCAEAQERDRRGAGVPVGIVGSDCDPNAIRIALEHRARAGFTKEVHFEKRSLGNLDLPKGWGESGLLLTNPPYGKRLGAEETLIPAYVGLGRVFKTKLGGWDAWVLSGNENLSAHLGLKAARRHVVHNGSIECRFLHYPVTALAPGRKSDSPFTNRLRKRLRHLRKWARREEVSCFRLYDADLAEYAVAVDLYGDAVHLQEYEAPEGIDPLRARHRLRDVLVGVSEVLEIPLDEIHYKVRRRQRGRNQYERLEEIGKLQEVREGGYRFWVNLTDYLDTGLFLEKRSTRALIESMAQGCRFLNLFAYTGTATVFAVGGGAITSTTVDSSARYLAWARKNLNLNGMKGREHQLIEADCLDWFGKDRGIYDLIFLDPPTYSSSRHRGTRFSVEQDHVRLIRRTLDRLAPGGTLLFATNCKGFRIDRDAMKDLVLQDLSAQSLPMDFERSARSHHLWKIQRK
jgi:23S rRNA (guanine2445-N2)-methyltransferase / 23S rRNA (guanine2069-N7)-methyltransferase